MPPELQSAEHLSRHQPTLAAARGVVTHPNIASPLPMTRDAPSPKAVVVPLRRAREEVKEPEGVPTPVRIPARETRVEQVAAPPPPKPSPYQVLPTDRNQPTGLPKQTLTQTRPLAHQAAPARDGAPASELKAHMARKKLRTSPQELPQWGQATLVTVHVIPWVLLVAVAFRLLPMRWQFDQWPMEWQTIASAAFALFILTDTMIVLWYVAFRKTGRSMG